MQTSKVRRNMPSIAK